MPTVLQLPCFNCGWPQDLRNLYPSREKKVPIIWYANVPRSSLRASLSPGQHWERDKSSLHPQLNRRNRGGVRWWPANTCCGCSLLWLYYRGWPASTCYGGSLLWPYYRGWPASTCYAGSLLWLYYRGWLANTCYGGSLLWLYYRGCMATIIYTLLTYCNKIPMFSWRGVETYPLELKEGCW